MSKLIEAIRSSRWETALGKLLVEFVSLDGRRYRDDFREVLADPRYARVENATGHGADLRLPALSKLLRPLTAQALDEYAYVLGEPGSLREWYIYLIGNSGNDVVAPRLRLIYDEADDDTRHELVAAFSTSTHGDDPVGNAFGLAAAEIVAVHLQPTRKNERARLMALVRRLSRDVHARISAQEAPTTRPVAFEHAHYALTPPGVVWGSYGAVLVHGLASRHADGRLVVERTGPYVPPITFPRTGLLDASAIVVSDALATVVREAKLSGVCLEPVIKQKVVAIDWHTWDPDANNPQRWPAGGKPENYILRRKDRPSLHAAVGNQWELSARRASAKVGRRRDAHWTPTYGVVLSLRAAKLLHKQAGTWLRLDPVVLHGTPPRWRSADLPEL